MCGRAPRNAEGARWQSGDAPDCKSVYTGSIPVLASTYTISYSTTPEKRTGVLVPCQRFDGPLQISVFPADCPHCGTKSVAFALGYESRATKDPRNIWDTHAMCGRCSRGILASSVVLGNSSQRSSPPPPTIAPSLPGTDAPRYVPGNVANFYRQAMECLPRALDVAGSMFGKTPETALKNRFPKIKGDLYHRIKGAKNAGGLTPDLAEYV